MSRAWSSSESVSSGGLFTIFYALFSIGFVTQSLEFKGAGISPENILDSFLTSEDLGFLRHHIRKTSGTLVLHSLLPLIYLVGYGYFTSVMDGYYERFPDFLFETAWASYGLSISVLLPVSALTLVFYWHRTDSHPMIRKISAYCQNNIPWTQVVQDIDTEFRRIDKFVIIMNPITKIVVTDNWILYVGQTPWSFHIAHQSDVTLKLIQSDHHTISTDGQAGGIQYLSIEVVNRKPGLGPFKFRLNSLEYQNLQDKIQCSIGNDDNIKIYKSISERFIEVFRAQVLLNPTVQYDSELEPCIGCMTVTANVRLQWLCGMENDTEYPCTTCYCRPMWCLTCMAKWFASKQNQNDTETWLGSKCPCPTCRNKFCVLDVCLIE